MRKTTNSRLIFATSHSPNWCSILGEAKNAFTNLKKRYSKKRNDVKRAKRSGAGLADVQRFENQLEVYSFLSWLYPFMKLRNDTRSNLPAAEKDEEDKEEMQSSSEEEQDIQDDPLSEDQQSTTDKLSDTESTVSIQSNKRKKFKKHESESQHLYSASSGRTNKEIKSKKPKPQDDPSTEILKVISKRFSEKSEISSKRVTEGEEDISGKMVTAELKSLPKHLSIRLKHDISSLIFKYQMMGLQQDAQQYSPISANTETGLPLGNYQFNTPPVMSSENTAYCQNRNGRHFTLPSNAAFGSNDESNNQWS